VLHRAELLARILRGLSDVVEEIRSRVRLEAMVQELVEDEIVESEEEEAVWGSEGDCSEGCPGSDHGDVLDFDYDRDARGEC
jgi:hypothetical protein